MKTTIRKAKAKLHMLFTKYAGERNENRVRVLFANVARRKAKRFTDLMREQQELWLSDPTYNEWDGSSKLLIKERAKQLGCPIPDTYLVCDSVSDLDFSNLPNRYVIKPSHMGGGRGVFVINEGKDVLTGQKIDEEVVRAELKDSLVRRQLGFHRESYSSLKPSIFAEELLPNEHGEFGVHIDYKVHLFHGRACLIRVSLGGAFQTEEHPDRFANCFTRDWQPIDYDEIIFDSHPRNYKLLPTPSHLDDLILWSERIAQMANKPFIRVDFFRTPSGFVLGECTLRPGRLRDKRITPFADRYMGRLWQYPELVDNAFDPVVVRNSDLAPLCPPGFQ